MDVIDLLLNAQPAKLPEKEYKIKRLSEELGGDVVFTLRALPFSRVAEIRAVSEENQPIHIVLAGVVSPDLKTPALLERFDAVTPAELISKMLLPGEIDDLALRVEQLSGYKTTVLEEVKKNSSLATN
ncbi:MAG: hypothetical protein FWG88_05035 [Oscillospiraceae bacterium]|nr:hypothetical protein [Oscillospiraceae bacterium]